MLSSPPPPQKMRPRFYYFFIRSFLRMRSLTFISKFKSPKMRPFDVRYKFVYVLYTKCTVALTFHISNRYLG